MRAGAGPVPLGCHKKENTMEDDGVDIEELFEALLEAQAAKTAATHGLECEDLYEILSILEDVPGFCAQQSQRRK